MTLIDGEFAATFRYRDEPRPAEGNLHPAFDTRITGSSAFCWSPGDRESEVRYLAEKVGINEVYAQPKPRAETIDSCENETKKSRHSFHGRRD